LNIGTTSKVHRKELNAHIQGVSYVKLGKPSFAKHVEQTQDFQRGGKYLEDVHAIFFLQI
jgi:hypothetical protein